VQGNLDKRIWALGHYGREGAISAFHPILWAPPSFLCNAFPYTLCVDIVLDPKWRGEGKE